MFPNKKNGMQKRFLSQLIFLIFLISCQKDSVSSKELFLTKAVFRQIARVQGASSNNGIQMIDINSQQIEYDELARVVKFSCKALASFDNTENRTYIVSYKNTTTEIDKIAISSDRVTLPYLYFEKINNSQLIVKFTPEPFAESKKKYNILNNTYYELNFGENQNLLSINQKSMYSQYNYNEYSLNYNASGNLSKVIDDGYSIEFSKWDKKNNPNKNNAVIFFLNMYSRTGSTSSYFPYLQQNNPTEIQTKLTQTYNKPFVIKYDYNQYGYPTRAFDNDNTIEVLYEYK